MRLPVQAVVEKRTTSLATHIGREALDGHHGWMHPNRKDRKMDLSRRGFLKFVRDLVGVGVMVPVLDKLPALQEPEPVEKVTEQLWEAVPAVPYVATAWSSDWGLFRPGPEVDLEREIRRAFVDTTDVRMVDPDPGKRPWRGETFVFVEDPRQ